MMHRHVALGRIARRLLGSAVPLALAAAFAASPAGAEVKVDSTTIHNTYSYGIGNVPDVGADPAGSTLSTYVGFDSLGVQSELGLNYNATADNNAFFFLHDHYCVGVCQTSSSTEIVFTLSNDQEGREVVRFDSQITPGHLAAVFGEGEMGGAFSFDVTQVIGDAMFPLYHAEGFAGPNGVSLNSGNLIFNSLNRVAGDGFELLDWGTTNLNLQLNPFFGQSQLIYTATYNTFVSEPCADLFGCSGVQVAFGDPRNDGGVTNFAAFAAAASDPTRPVIGGIFDPHLVTFAFVPVDPDGGPALPDQPGAPEQPTYNRLFQSNAVPEPASWALMILGFGLAGSAVRRRRAAAQPA